MSSLNPSPPHGRGPSALENLTTGSPSSTEDMPDQDTGENDRPSGTGPFSQDAGKDGQPRASPARGAQ